MAGRGDFGKQLKPIDWEALNDPNTPVSQFAAWAKGILSSLREQPNPLLIQATKAVLLDRFMFLRADVPRKERYKAGSPDQPSLVSVLEDAYNELHEIEQTALPHFAGMAFQQPAKPEEAPGLYIGEADTDEDV
ncbi:MAG: hypothetical protein ACR2IV_17520 [Bryobacteraceae bacterium]